MSRMQEVQELRNMFSQMKSAFTPVPPHPAHQPPEQGMPPQGGMPPEQGMPPGMPPEQGMPPGMPPEQGMPPGGMPPEQGGPPPEMMELMDQLLTQVEATVQSSKAEIAEIRNDNNSLRQELMRMQAEFDKDKALKQQRKELINQVVV